MKRISALLFTIALTASAWGADLSGHWVVETHNNDGTTRKTFLMLKQDGENLTGKVGFAWADQDIRDGSVHGDKLSFVVAYGHPPNERLIHWSGTVENDELHLTEARGRRAPEEMIAKRTSDNAGNPPEKLPVPELHEVPYNGLAKTPQMGWNSWNHFAGKIDDKTVREIADAMVANGMKAAGYIYVNIDDTWELDRDANGEIRTNKKFPDMKALADYVHSKGLKLGIYSSPGPLTCAGYEGSYGHEAQDAKTYAKWGIDYLKYDWCGAGRIYQDSDMRAVYQKMGDALQASGRPIFFSLCQYGRDNSWEWAPKVGGNSWRTTGDIQDNWKSMSTIGFGQNDLAKWAGPGHWNDPDMLEVGNGGMTNAEYRTHMSLWSMLSSPLLAGNDLRHVGPDILAILENKDVIAIDQDTAGHQATRLKKDGDSEVWTKHLANGDTAIALFNRGEASAKIGVEWSEIGLNKKPHLRDLWSHRSVKAEKNGYSATVASHGVVLVRVSGGR